MAALVNEQRVKIKELEEMLPEGRNPETENLLLANNFYSLKEEYCTKVE